MKTSGRGSLGGATGGEATNLNAGNRLQGKHLGTKAAGKEWGYDAWMTGGEQ